MFQSSLPGWRVDPMILLIGALFVAQTSRAPVLEVEVIGNDLISIVSLIRSAKHSLVIGANRITDPMIINLLAEARKSGIRMTTLTAHMRTTFDCARYDPSWMPKLGFVVVDESLLWLGSADWSFDTYGKRSSVLALRRAESLKWRALLRRTTRSRPATASK